MEREILFTGIGGQGVQLAAKMLAYAGMLEGRQVMQFSMFMGTMRGGSSECTIVVGDGPIEAPPVVPRAWAAVAMHPSELGLLQKKLRSGGAILFNQTLLESPPTRPDCRWLPVDAVGLATQRSNLQGQSLVALGAFCALTGIVKFESLENALYQMLPSYRHHTIPKNMDCLTAGADALGSAAGTFPAWSA
jgi:2-oxoglutarate ferredoxin oxidoreductase subunit gamma